MKKISLIILFITILLLAGCVTQQPPEPEKPDQITLSQIGASGHLHNKTSSWEILELADYDLWILYIKKDRLATPLNSAEAYAVVLDGHDYRLESNPFNPNILKLLLPSHMKPNQPALLVIQTLNARESVKMKNDIPLAIEKIYLTKDEINGTTLNEVSVVDYTDMYTDADQNNFAWDNGTFIRPSHVKSNEENAYANNTYFDARTVADTESATGAFAFLKTVADYEQYIVMENPNRFQVTGDATQLLVPDDRWRIRQLGDEVFTLVDDPTQQQFVLSIDKDTLPATYTNTYFWETQLKEATVCWFDKTDEINRSETVIAYMDTASTELILNSRFEAVEYNAPDITLKTPTDGTGLGETSVTLTWYATPGSRKDAETVGGREANTIGISEYAIYFATDGTDYPKPATTTQMSLEKSGLQYGTIYKWTVEAFQNDTQSASSTQATFSTSPLSTNTDFTLTGVDPQLIQYKSCSPDATVLKLASETTVATVLANMASADDSDQTYIIYDSDSSQEDPLNNTDILTKAATLVVTSEHGAPYVKEYAIEINPTAFVRLEKTQENVSNRNGVTIQISWHDTIVDAVASANTTEMSTITVWPGTYKENITITKPIHLKSTDPESETVRNNTILDGNENSVVITIGETPMHSGREFPRQTSSCIVEGFTITNAMGENPPGSSERNIHSSGQAFGVLINNFDTIIRNDLITKNGTTTVDRGAMGIGIAAPTAVVKIHDNTISHNTYTVCYYTSMERGGQPNEPGGAGIYVYTGSPEIYANTISDNTSNANGGGICLGYRPDESSSIREDLTAQASPVLYNNDIKNNTAMNGAGVYVYQNMDVLNGDNEEWKRFNVPNANVSFVEHNSNSVNDNTYDFNEIDQVTVPSRNGGDEGVDICFETQKTFLGGSQTAPSNVDETATFTFLTRYFFQGETLEGTVTFQVPSELDLSEEASITINGESRTLKAEEFDADEGTVYVTGITGNYPIVTLELNQTSEIPAGIYHIKVIADADGTGTAYSPSGNLNDSGIPCTTLTINSLGIFTLEKEGS